MGRKCKIFYILVVFIVSLLAVEGIARFLTRGPRLINPYYLEMSKDFAQLEHLVNNNQNTRPMPRYYDEFLYGSAAFSSTHVNFTDYYSARWTPDSVPLTEAKHIVWTFGGSTLQNQETTDELSIANTLAKEFNRTLGPTHVKNFGEGSFFSSYELIKFQKLLREITESELPDMVIFYDGYNDANHSYLFGAGNMQQDLSQKLEALVEGKYLVLGTYALSQKMSQISRFWELTGGRFLQYVLFPPAPLQGDEDNLAAGVRVYTSNVMMGKAICQKFEIECYFILQPLIVTKTPLNSLEQEVLENLKIGPEGVRFVREYYRRVRSALKDDEQFFDASHIMNGRYQPDFYDLGHTAAQTPPFIGETIARMIMDQRNTKDGS